MRSRQPDPARAVAAIAEFLAATGHALEGELIGTPERVAAAFIDELLRGDCDTATSLLAQERFQLHAPQALVVVRDIAITVVCPHHLLPGSGTATVAFVPGKYGVGLGVIAQATHLASARLVLQEQLGPDICRVLMNGLSARGAACRLKLQHACLSLRGERERLASVESLTLTGSCDGADRDVVLGAL